jgi:hypothetical protein
VRQSDGLARTPSARASARAPHVEGAPGKLVQHTKQLPRQRLAGRGAHRSTCERRAAGICTIGAQARCRGRIYRPARAGLLPSVRRSVGVVGTMAWLSGRRPIACCPPRARGRRFCGRLPPRRHAKSLPFSWRKNRREISNSFSTACCRGARGGRPFVDRTAPRPPARARGPRSPQLRAPRSVPARSRAPRAAPRQQSFCSIDAGPPSPRAPRKAPHRARSRRHGQGAPRRAVARGALRPWAQHLRQL